MKNILKIIVILCLILAGLPAVFANSYADTSQTSLVDAETGKTKTYKTVNLFLGGKHVVTDVPSILFVQDGNSRTLVPLRFITDNLGAGVTWDNDSKEATIILKDKIIVLQANSSTALVDGKPYTLPDNVPVKLMGIGTNFRTMVPIRFVSEQLGMDVGWIQDTRTVTISKPIPSVKSVAFNEDAEHPELVFKTTGEIAFTSEYTQEKEAGGSDRLVIDMPNTKFDMDSKTDIDTNGALRMEIDTDDIRTVQGFQLEVVPYRTRFVVSIDQSMTYKTEYDSDNKEIHLVFTKNKPVVADVDTDTDGMIPIDTGTNPHTKTVVIDAGHGGNDPGATSPFSHVREKDLNLIMAQKLELKLETYGIKVAVTRSDDTYIGLHDRPAIANNLNADAFLSIHFNAASNPNTSGVEMLYVADARNSKAFAQVLQDEVCRATGTYSRGLVVRPNLVVIRETAMPAVLAELGFLTNAGEEQRILEEAYQDQLVQGMVNGIMKYFSSNDYF